LRVRAALFALVVLVVSGPAVAKPKLTLWHAYRGEEERALAEILKGFTAADLEVLSVPSDAFDSKLASAALVGEAPDVLIAEHHHLGDYRGRGIVAPVGDAFEGDAAFIDPAVRALRDGDEMWGVPLSPKCVALFVNDALVKRTPPDLEGIAEMKATLPQGVFPLVYEAKNPYAHAPIFGAFGGVLLTKDDQFGLAGPAAEQSLALARGLIVQGAVPQDADYNLIKELFKAGKAAFVISGPWFAGELTSAKDLRYHVEVLPAVRAAGQPMRPLLTVESAILSKEGAAKPEARALAKWLGGKDAAQIRTRVARMLTARADVPMPDDDPMLRVFAQQARETIPMPSSRAMQAVWNPAERAITKVLRGDAPPDVALAEAKRRYDSVRRPLPAAASPTPFLLGLGVILLGVVLVWVQRARRGDLTAEVKRSLPAYAYVAHSVLVVGLLVIAPLTVGAATAFFSGNLLGSAERRFVGIANFVEILTAQGGTLLGSGSFYVVLLVTLLWTFANLFFHVTIGIALGLCSRSRR
jgi:arabinogalactan oligomer/maltooligosaccharide transport system permease protein